MFRARIGEILYWVGLPLLVLLLRRSERTRVALWHDEQLLVVKNWIGNGKWSLPGGGLHKNEPAVDGALRELREETGIVLTGHDMQLEGRYCQGSRLGGFTYTLFAVKLADRPAIDKQRLEIIDAQWLSAAALRSHAHNDDVAAALAALEKDV